MVTVSATKHTVPSMGFVVWERRRIIKALDLACVKAPFSDGKQGTPTKAHSEVEHMWLAEVDFDGQFVSGVRSTEGIYAAAAAAGVRPDPLLTISQWADRYRWLSQRASAEHGRWRTERTPYLREIMDCLSPSSLIERVAFMRMTDIYGL